MTVTEALTDAQEAGGLAYLGELAKNIPSVANIGAYAEIVRERAHLRELIRLGHECSRSASDAGAKSADVQEQIKQKLFALGEGRSPNAFLDINDALMKVVEQVDFHFNHGSGVTGVPSGLKDLAGVVGVTTVHRLACGFQNMWRCIEVRFTDGEVNDVAPLGAQPRDQRVGGDTGRGSNAENASRQEYAAHMVGFHSRPAFASGFTSQDCSG